MILPSDVRDSPYQTASVRPTGTTLCMLATCSGHIDRRGERCGDNPASVVKVIARKVRFLAMPAIARIRLIWQD